MRETEIRELKGKILKGDFSFIEKIYRIVLRNKVLFSDNFGEVSKDEKEAIEYLEPFMHLLYRGSKHSVGCQCESGFVRVVVYKDVNLKFKYYSGPSTFVEVSLIEDINNIKPLVTMDLLQERLQEAEEVKSELAPIIEKYIRQGLTFEEITKMFVEIMKENRNNIKNIRRF